MTQAQMQAYLQRLGLDSIPAPDAAALCELVRIHPERIPFENLDAFDLHRVPALDFESLFAKIITGFRGGYCFELNRLFMELLLQLGYKAYPLQVRILRNRPQLPPPLHMGVIVETRGRKYYCDVGYGGPGPRTAIPLEEGEYPCNGDMFRMHREESGEWILFRMDDGQWTKLFLIEDRPAHLVDFDLPNFYCATNPQGRFATMRIVNLNLPDGGSKALTDLELVVRSGGTVSRKYFNTREELRDGLWTEFGIRFE